MIQSWLAGFGVEGWLLLALTSATILLIAVILAVIFDKLIYPIILRFTNWTPTDLDARLTRAFRKPLSLAIVLVGGYLAIVLPYELTPHTLQVVERVTGVIAVILGTSALAMAVSNLFQWYVEVISPRTASSLDDRLIPMLRRVAIALAYGLGALVALDLLQVNISPLIAGLGLSGLAVALALQPTLANLFAGTYVMTEGVVHPGDYIELENGVAGYVIDVSWRSTRLRTWTNNLVVVPNSRFAETIITNYQGPIPAVNIYLTCGVSYDSDLALVERVCQEEMNRLLDADDRAVKEYGAYFAYESFDDSNVMFYLFIQAKDRIASFEVQSELIRMVHERFREEGIVINYPMRTINFAATPGDGPEPSRPTATANESPGITRQRLEAPASNVGDGDGAGGDGPDVG